MCMSLFRSDKNGRREPKQEPVLEKQHDKQKIHEKELATIGKGAGISFAGKLLGGGLQYFYAVFVARILGAESLGILMIGITIINFAGVISRFGLDFGLVRYISLYNGVGDKARVKGVIVKSLEYSFFAGLFIGIVLFFNADAVAVRIFRAPELGGIIKLLSVSLPFSALMLNSLFSIQGFKIMKYTVYGQNLFLPVSNLLLAGILLIAGLKIYGVVIAYSLSVFLASLLSIYFLFKVFPAIKHLKAVYETNELFRFSLPLLLVVLMNFLIMLTDTLMLGYFRPKNEVGVYNAAVRTALITSLVLVSFNSIFAPVISDLFNKREIRKLEALFKAATKWIYTISFPLFLLMTLLSKEIMSVFGQEFIGGRNAFVILAFAQMVNAGVGSVGFILTMSGRQNLMMYNTLGICLLNIFLNFLLIPPYGILGAAVASCVSVVIINLLMLFEVYVLYKIHPYRLNFLKPTVSGATVFAMLLLAGYLFPGAGAVQRLLINIPVFITAFILMIRCLGIDDDDRIIINIFKLKFRRVFT